MKGKFSKEIIIGIVTILSLVLLYIGINYLKGINLFKPANYYYVSCSNVKDINISSPVFVEGFKVGLVRDIVYDYSTVNRITLEIRLDRGMRLNKGSYVTIESTLLSGAELHIRLNKYVTEYYKPGDVLEGRFKEGMLSSVEEQILPQLAGLLPKIDSILTGLQTLVNNQALPQTLSNLEATTAQLETSAIRLNAFLKNDIPQISSGLKETSANLTTFSHNLNQLNFEPTIDSLNATLGNFNALSQRFNSKDNTFGLLLNDTTLYRNLNQVTDNASLLLIDIKQNPRKYLNLSIFSRRTN